jgi:hypothetical protein
MRAYRFMQRHCQKTQIAGSRGKLLVSRAVTYAESSANGVEERGTQLASALAGGESRNV